MSSLPILYSFRRCPSAIRARLALLASQTVCIIREVKLSAKPTEILVASSTATVSVLVLPDGDVIEQSLDIMRWALARCDPGSWLNHDGDHLIAINDGPSSIISTAPNILIATAAMPGCTSQPVSICCGRSRRG